MPGAPRRQAHSWARSFFLLPSVLALLALALFPVMAHAESSSGAVYETEIPEVKTPVHHKTHAGEAGGSNKSGGGHSKSSNNPTAKGSEAETGNSGTGGTETEPESEEQSSGGVSGGGNNNPPTRGGGEGGKNPGKSTGVAGNSKPQDNISAAKEVTTKGTPASESSGGSSPLVPILIAIVVLAAISIGVVLYRQRKSGQGPGGRADGRMSSSNAS